jgi:hypothetical protein
MRESTGWRIHESECAACGRPRAAAFLSLFLEERWQDAHEAEATPKAIGRGGSRRHRANRGGAGPGAQIRHRLAPRHVYEASRLFPPVPAPRSLARRARTKHAHIMDSWAVAMLGEGSVGKSALVQQVRVPRTR